MAVKTQFKLFDKEPLPDNEIFDGNLFHFSDVFIISNPTREKILAFCKRMEFVPVGLNLVPDSEFEEIAAGPSQEQLREFQDGQAIIIERPGKLLVRGSVSRPKDYSVAFAYQFQLTPVGLKKTPLGSYDVQDGRGLDDRWPGCRIYSTENTEMMKRYEEQAQIVMSVHNLLQEVSPEELAMIRKLVDPTEHTAAQMSEVKAALYPPLPAQD